MRMKLSRYAKQLGISYKTAFRLWQAGMLDAYQLPTGTVIVRDPEPQREWSRLRSGSQCRTQLAVVIYR